MVLWVRCNFFKDTPKKNIMRLRSIAVISSSSTVCTLSLISDTEPFGGSPRRFSNTSVIVNANEGSVSGSSSPSSIF